MSFVTGGLLFGAALIAIPIAIHLIMRQQPKHLLFPALRFIRLREHANRRNLRLRHLILLLLRCAAIALLAFALARPSITATGLIDQEAPIAAALIFDTSPRMDYKHENTTRLAAAKEMGEWMVGQLPPESELAVVDSGSQVASFAVHTGAAKQRIERLAITAAAQPLTESLDQAVRLLKTSDKPRKEIYIFTDLSRSGWPADGVQRLRRQIDALKEMGIYVIDVGVEEPQNFALGEITLSPGQIISQNSSLKIETRLTRKGPAENRAVGLYVLDKDGKASQRSQQEHQFDPASAKTIEFQIGSLPSGTTQGYLQILGEDSLPADDIRYFTLDVRPPWKVLIVANNPVSKTASALRRALEPPGFVRLGIRRYAVTVIPFLKLADAKLDDYAAIVLLDPPPQSAAVWQGLTAFANSGGGLALFLGRNARSPEAFNDPAALDVLPGKLVRTWENQTEYFSPENFDHPVLRGFKPYGDSVPWDLFPIQKFWQVTPQGEGADVILPLHNQKPGLIERPVGRGRVLLMSTPISDLPGDRDGWNLFPESIEGENWAFMVLADHLVRYLVTRVDEQLVFAAGDTARLHLPSEDRQSVLSLTTPRGEVVPQTVTHEGAVSVSATEQAGNYQLESGGEEGLRRGFSVNLRPEVTELDRLTSDELNGFFEGAEVRVARNREGIDRAVSSGRIGRELYPFLIMALALILGVEQFLANRFYKPTAADKLVGAGRPANPLAESMAEVAPRGAPPPLPPVPPPLAGVR